MADDPAASDVPSLESIQQDLAAALAEIGLLHMPFGKYGPQSFPPNGVPLYDLPVDYLIWFKQKGFPKGKLGKLLELVCQIKVDGAESVFQPFRDAAGGRHPLKPKRKRDIIIDP